jgi:hypothetical protein
MNNRESQYPCGFLDVAYLHGVQVDGGSNPSAPTNEIKDLALCMTSFPVPEIDDHLISVVAQFYHQKQVIEKFEELFAYSVPHGNAMSMAEASGMASLM